MKVGLITGQATLELLEFAEPEPAVDGVVVDIAYCGICGTDVHAYQAGARYNPAICGHEWFGTLSAVGAEVTGLTEGDDVVVAVPPACGRCEACVAGHADTCKAVLMTQIGAGVGAAPHGGFAPRLGVHAGRVMRADPGLSPIEAAQVEPATVTFHAVRNSGLTLGDFVIVQGAGPIGLLTAQWARAGGAGRVMAIEPSEARRTLALSLGVDVAVTPGDDAGETARELTHGLGADLVYECVGRPETVQTAVDLTRRGGSMCLIGLADAMAPIDPTQWLMKEVRVTAALAYTHAEFEACMGMIADGRVDVASLHTSTIGLDDLPATMATLADGTSTDTKVLVDPNR
ncbi:MAG: zinc-binding dehydrogenase [Acidimicrobiia bacterium]|nr:zinc-binding dehydrogenase [Acidimicrobiia bacterium]